MNINRLAMIRLLIGSTIAFAPLSCAIPPGLEGQPLSDRAVVYNKAVATAHERIILLNILRAAHRRPQQWSYISRVRGSEGREASAALAFPFGGDAPLQSTGTTAARVSSTPGFDLDTLGDAEFTQGIMRPLDKEQLRYFVDQGWPLGFLILLTTREIVRQELRELEASAGTKSARWVTVQRWENNPGAPGSSRLKEFCEQVEKFIKTDNLDVIVVEGEKKSIRFPLDSVPASLEHVLKAMDSDREVEVIGNELVITSKGKPMVKLAFRITLTEETPEQQGTYVHEVASEPNFLLGQVDQVAGTPQPETAPTEDSAKHRYVLVPRSPEGVVYYLGQLARAQKELAAEGRTEDLSRVVPWYWTKDSTGEGMRLGLFMIALGPQPQEGGFPAVEYEGAQYHVPGTWTWQEGSVVGDRSLMTMTFVHLLFGLHRKGKEFPSTPVVVAQ